MTRDSPQSFSLTGVCREGICHKTRNTSWVCEPCSSPGQRRVISDFPPSAGQILDISGIQKSVRNFRKSAKHNPRGSHVRLNPASPRAHSPPTRCSPSLSSPALRLSAPLPRTSAPSAAALARCAWSSTLIPSRTTHLASPVASSASAPPRSAPPSRRASPFPPPRRRRRSSPDTNRSTATTCVPLVDARTPTPVADPTKNPSSGKINNAFSSFPMHVFELSYARPLTPRPPILLPFSA